MSIVNPVTNTTDPFVLARTLKGECAPHIKAIAHGVCSDRSTIGAVRKWLGTDVTAPLAVIEEAKKKTGCSSESCAIQKFAGESGADRTAALSRFTPEGPWKSTQWLSNTDIDDVLAGYTKRFPRFCHVQFQMRDFAKRRGALALVDWSDVVARYDCLASIVNTDLTDNSGEHWTAFFVDIKGGTVEYFDSAVGELHQEFIDWAIETAHTLTRLTGRTFRDVMVRKVEHQKENTECGVYSLYYVLSRLLGVGYTAFEYRRVPDKEMVAFRPSVFRNS